MKKILVVGAVIAALAYGSGALAATAPPPTLTNGGSPSSPSLLITILANGTAQITNTSACPSGSCPYDGSDDTYVGVLNNSSSVVNSLVLTGNTDIFGFEGDGIDAYGGGSNATDTAQYGTSAYGGGDAYFTAINGATTSGTVNFIGGINANGGQGYFSLEEALTTATFSGGGGITTGGGVPEPTSWALMLMGFFGMGALLRRHRQGAAALA